MRFADLTWAGAGPFGTKIFSDFGAEIVKVESSVRLDSVRTGGPFKDRQFGVNRSGYFASRNSGSTKRRLNRLKPMWAFNVRTLTSGMRPDCAGRCHHGA